MNETKSHYINISIHAALLFLLTAVQTGLWYRFFNGIPAPIFWIHFLTYICLYRSNKDIMWLALVGFVILSSFTLIPHGSLFLISFLVILFLVNFKTRIFWPGPTYFLLSSGIAASLFVISYYLITLIFEETRAPSVRWLYLFLQITFTMLISPIFYFIFHIIDKLSGKEQNLPMEEVV